VCRLIRSSGKFGAIPGQLAVSFVLLKYLFQVFNFILVRSIFIPNWYYKLGKDLWMVKRSIEDLLNILGIEEGNLMVAPVSTSWDRVLGWLSHIPPPLGGRHLNLLARRILWLFQHRVLQELVKQVKP
jgi:hypothetical protein